MEKILKDGETPIEDAEVEYDSQGNWIETLKESSDYSEIDSNDDEFTKTEKHWRKWKWLTNSMKQLFGVHSDTEHWSISKFISWVAIRKALKLTGNYLNIQRKFHLKRNAGMRQPEPTARVEQIKTQLFVEWTLDLLSAHNRKMKKWLPRACKYWTRAIESTIQKIRHIEDHKHTQQELIMDHSIRNKDPDEMGAMHWDGRRVDLYPSVLMRDGNGNRLDPKTGHVVAKKDEKKWRTQNTLATLQAQASFRPDVEDWTDLVGKKLLSDPKDLIQCFEELRRDTRKWINIVLADEDEIKRRMHLRNIKFKDDLSHDENTVRFVVAELLDKKKAIVLMKWLEISIENRLLGKIADLMDLTHRDVDDDKILGAAVGGENAVKATSLPGDDQERPEFMSKKTIHDRWDLMREDPDAWVKLKLRSESCLVSVEELAAAMLKYEFREHHGDLLMKFEWEKELSDDLTSESLSEMSFSSELSDQTQDSIDSDDVQAGLGSFRSRKGKHRGHSKKDKQARYRAEERARQMRKDRKRFLDERYEVDDGEGSFYGGRWTPGSPKARSPKTGH